MKREKIYKKSIDLLVIVYLSSYFGIFASYKGAVLLAGICILCCLFLNFLHKRQVSVDGNIISSLWLIVFVYILISALFNIPYSLLYLLPFLFGYIILFRKTGMPNWEFVLSAIKLIASILAISIYCQMLFPDLFYSVARHWFYYSNQFDLVYRTHMISHQYSGLFYEVSYSAFVICLGISVTFIESLFKKKRRALNVIITILLYGAVILTGKRSFMLLIPVLMVLFFLYFNPNKSVYWYILGVLGITIFILFSGIIYDWIFDILTKGNGTNGIMLSGREEYWRLAANMFKENPLFGKGINSFDIYFNNSGIKNDYFFFAGAHNSYVQMFAELGIIGGGLFYIVCFLEIITNIKNIKRVSKTDETRMFYSGISLFSLLVIFAYAFSGNVVHQPQQLLVIFFYFNIINTINKEVNISRRDQFNEDNLHIKKRV